MKKAPAIALLVLILYQLVGYYSIHQLQVYKVKKEVKKQIKNSIPQDKLTIISFPITEQEKIQWVKEDKEFIYKNQLYDVIIAKVENNTLYFYCIADFKETALFAKLDDYVNNFIDSNSKQQKENSRVFSRFQFEYLLQKQITTTPQVTRNHKRNSFLKIPNYQAFLKIESPPPKFHFS